MGKRPGPHALPRPRLPLATGVVEGKAVDMPPRCAACGRPIGEYAARPWSLKCRHCKAETRAH